MFRLYGRIGMKRMSGMVKGGILKDMAGRLGATAVVAATLFALASTISCSSPGIDLARQNYEVEVGPDGFGKRILVLRDGEIIHEIVPEHQDRMFGGKSRLVLL